MIARAAPREAATLTALAHAAKRHWGYPEDWITQWANTLTVTPECLAAHPTQAAGEDGSCVGFCTVVVAGSDARLEHLWVLPAAIGCHRSLQNQPPVVTSLRPHEFRKCRQAVSIREPPSEPKARRFLNWNCEVTKTDWPD
jgi:hypothetical protein